METNQDLHRGTLVSSQDSLQVSTPNSSAFCSMLYTMPHRTSKHIPFRSQTSIVDFLCDRHSCSGQAYLPLVSFSPLTSPVGRTTSFRNPARLIFSVLGGEQLSRPALKATTRFATCTTQPNGPLYALSHHINPQIRRTLFNLERVLV